MVTLLRVKSCESSSIWIIDAAHDDFGNCYSDSQVYIVFKINLIYIVLSDSEPVCKSSESLQRCIKGQIRGDGRSATGQSQGTGRRSNTGFTNLVKRSRKWGGGCGTNEGGRNRFTGESADGGKVEVRAGQEGAAECDMSFSSRQKQSETDWMNCDRIYSAHNTEPWQLRTENTEKTASASVWEFKCSLSKTLRCEVDSVNSFLKPVGVHVITTCRSLSGAWDVFAFLFSLMRSKKNTLTANHQVSVINTVSVYRACPCILKGVIFQLLLTCKLFVGLRPDSQ